MAITSLDQWIAAARQNVPLKKTASRTAIAAQWFSVFNLAGSPGAGVLAGANTANGVVPTDATAGTPAINAFGGGNTGYLGAVHYGSTVACRIRVCDLLFKAGAYNFNANTTLASQPSFLGRVPGGAAADTAGETEIWVEQVTAATGNQAVNVTYLNEASASSVTGAVGIGSAPTIGRMWQLTLAAGDRGVSRINNVAGTVATAGTFNVLVLRELFTLRVRSASDGGVLSFVDSKMREIFEDSALFAMVAPDSTQTGIFDLNIEIKNG